MAVSATQSILVGVTDLNASLKLFRDVMRLRVEWQAPASPSLLHAWGVAAGVSAQLAELSCNGYPVGRLRLAEFSPTPSVRVRSDFGPHAIDSPLDVGPKAIDFYVSDPIGPSLEAVVAAGYPARSAPRKHQIGESISEEVVISGPDDVPMLLMVGHRHRATSLRPGSPDGPFSEIATASIICGDLAASRLFYGERLGLVPVNDAETPIAYRSLVNDLVDAPRDTRVHFLLYAQPGEASGKILLIHFHDSPAKRLIGCMRPGRLGFSLLSHHVANVDELHASFQRDKAPVVKAPATVATPTGQRRLMLVRGPNEELFEFSAPA